MLRSRTSLAVFVVFFALFFCGTVGAAEKAKGETAKVSPKKAAEEASEKETTKPSDESEESDSESATSAPPKKRTQKNETAEEEDKEFESTWAVGGTGQILSTIVPVKFGAYANYVWDRSLTTELSVVHGSITLPGWVGDIGSVSETSVMLLNRSQIGESRTTSWIYGLSYNRFNIKVGDSIISRVSGGSVPNIDVLESETLGAVVGIGTRWQWNNGVHLNLDWFTLNQPLITLKSKSDINNYVTNQTDRENIDKGFRTIRYFPLITLFKVGLGYTF